MNTKTLEKSLLTTATEIHVVILEYEDGSSRAWAFSCLDRYESFLEYLSDAAQALGVVKYTMYDSILDASCDADYRMFGTWH